MGNIISDITRNVIVGKDSVKSAWGHKAATVKGFLTRQEYDLKTQQNYDVNVQKPSYDMLVEYPYEQGEIEYQRAKEEYDKALKDNPDSIGNMVGGVVTGIQGEIPEAALLAFGSNEEILKYYENYDNIRKQEKEQKKAQKKTDEANRERAKSAGDNLDLAKLKEKMNKRNKEANQLSYDNALRQWSLTKNPDKAGDSEKSGVIADDDFDLF